MKTTDPRRTYNVGVMVPFILAADDLDAARRLGLGVVQVAMEVLDDNNGWPLETATGITMAYGDPVIAYAEDRNPEDRMTLEDVTATFSVPASEAPIAPMEGYE